MNDCEVSKKVWELYEEEMKSRSNSDYVVDEAQMRKLIDAYAFFVEIVERDGGQLEPFRIKPKEISGGITAYFTVFYVSGSDMARFSEIVGNMSSISLDSTADGDVCISFTIPNVFTKRK